MISLSTIKSGIRVVKKLAIHYAPQILTGVGIGMMAGATVHAAKVAPKAKEEIDEINNDPTIQRPGVEKSLTYLKYFWLTMVLTGAGAGLIIGGQHVSLRRLSMATAALSMEKDKIKKLEDKIAEKFGEKKLLETKDEIIQDEVKQEVQKNDGFNSAAVYNTGKGTMLCYDICGKRLFWSDLEYIRRMRDMFNNDITRQMQRGNMAVMSLNDWYDYIELPQLDGKMDDSSKIFGPNFGKDYGWRNRTMELRITSGMLENDQTYFAIGFTEEGAPRLDENITDDYGCPFSEDDETDMKWRGR